MKNINWFLEYKNLYGDMVVKKLCIVKCCVEGTIHHSKVTQKSMKEARWKDKGARTYKGKSGFTNELRT